MTAVLRQEAEKRWTVTIPANDSKSNSFPISEKCPRGLSVLVAAWTAADLAIEVSDDGNNWFPLKSNGAKVKVTSLPTSSPVPSYWVMPAAAWAAGAFAQARLVSVSTSAEDTYVVQAAARTLIVVPLS